MTAGRPSSFTQVVADEICSQLSVGVSLTSWCKRDGNPSTSMVFRWLADNEKFREQYARAREAQADFLAEEIIDIANTPKLGVQTKLDEDGKVIEVRKGDMIEHRRLQIDARKWYAGKLRPKVYGDRIQQDHSGELTVKGLAERMREQRQVGDEAGGFA